MNKYYIAIIGDIVKSRNLSDRNEVQQKVKITLDNVNTIFAEYIEAKFIITLGDEFQGLLKSPSPIYKILTYIFEELYPVQIRFGVGFGPISTEHNELAIGMDGPAFYYAREAMDRAKERKGYSIIFKSKIIASREEASINAMLKLQTVIRKLWSPKFKKLIPFLRKGYKQNELADKFNSTQPNISFIVNTSYWGEVSEAEETVDEFIMDCLSKYNSTTL